MEGKVKSDEGKWDAYMSNISIPAPKLAVYVNYEPLRNTYVNLQYVHTAGPIYIVVGVMAT